MKYFISAKLWDAVSGDTLHTFEHEHIVKSVNFSNSDSLLVTASNEKLLRVFDLNKPEIGENSIYFLINYPFISHPIGFFFQIVLQKFSGHTSGIRHVSFFRNDTALVSAGEDNTVRIWDRNTGSVSNYKFES